MSKPGKKLNAKLCLLGYSQAEAADRVGISQQELSRLIRGEKTPSLKTAIAIELAFEIPVAAWVTL